MPLMSFAASPAPIVKQKEQKSEKERIPKGMPFLVKKIVLEMKFTQHPTMSLVVNVGP
jgi:hypothetical protein